MSKEECREYLISTSDVINEMLEMLDSDEPDGLQSFLEAYESASEYLIRAVKIAVLATAPKLPE